MKVYEAFFLKKCCSNLTAIFLFVLEGKLPRGIMQPTIVRNFGEPQVPPIDDDLTIAATERILRDEYPIWSETKESENGASPTSTIPTTTESIWRPNGENIALTSAINQSSVATPEELISKAMSAFSPLGRSVESKTPYSTPQGSPVSTSNPRKVPKKRQLPTVVRKTRSMTLLDSALQTLATLKISLQDEVKELETILATVPLYLEQAEHLLKSQKPTLTRLSSSTRDSLPTNNLFASSPVFETKEDYFRSSGCSGSTDPLAPERRELFLKKQAKKQFTQNPLEIDGSMDTEENL